MTTMTTNSFSSRAQISVGGSKVELYRLDALAKAGVVVSAHEPHWVDETVHSAGYIAVKKAKLGHLT